MTTTQSAPAPAPVQASATGPGVPSARTIAYVLALGGAVGTAAAFALIIDRIRLLANPEFVPSCSISPVLSCGSVMTSPQAEVFGFPNPLIGLVTFPVLATLGVVLLTGALLPRWIWAGLQVGTLLGTVFIHWLIAQSLYVIGALCPYCMTVWVAAITAFWYVTLRNLDATRAVLPGWLQTITARIRAVHAAALTVWLLGIAALAVTRFWDYWAGIVR